MKKAFFLFVWEKAQPFSLFSGIQLMNGYSIGTI